MKEESVLFQALMLYAEMTTPSNLMKRFLWLEKKMGKMDSAVGLRKMRGMANTVKESAGTIFGHHLYHELCGQLMASECPIAHCNIGSVKSCLLESRR